MTDLDKVQARVDRAHGTGVYKIIASRNVNGPAVARCAKGHEFEVNRTRLFWDRSNEQCPICKDEYKARIAKQ